MEVIFSPAKDARNRRKHRISLKRAEEFDMHTALFDVDDSQDYGEVRYNAIGWLNAKIYSLTFTPAVDAIRAISLRRATKEEQRRYAEEF